MATDPSPAPRKPWALLAGPVLAILAGLAAWMAGLPNPACFTAAVTTLCAVWWVLEPIPIPATSMIPFAAFPLLGVMKHTEVATAYGHSMILLLLGGFMLSAAVEKSGAHKRIALGLVAISGDSDRGLVLGFMLASGLCSMWISNTATTLMLLPVALAALENRNRPDLSRALLLGIAYSASIGGMATPVGTPPNVIFMGAYQEATGTEVSFLSWMSIGVPVALIMVPVVWLWLTRRLPSHAEGVAPARAKVAMAPITAPEVRVLAVFALTAAAWICRTAPFGGWSTWFDVGTAGDATVAMAAVVLLFIIPSGATTSDGDGDGGKLLDWQTAAKIPWGLLILFGGGIAIAKAFGASGLSTAIGDVLTSLADWPTLVMIGMIALAVTFMTEVTSNTATTTLLMPMLASAAVAASIDPRLLMIPAALSASCAFMLPVATAPNAIMFGTGKIPTVWMAKEGFALNLVGIVVITTICSLILPRL